MCLSWAPFHSSPCSRCFSPTQAPLLFQHTLLYTLVASRVSGPVFLHIRQLISARYLPAQDGRTCGLYLPLLAFVHEL